MSGARGYSALAVVLALAACAMPGDNDISKGPQPLPKAVAGYTAMNGAQGELIVKRAGTPFGYADGAEAKRAANSFCPAGVASGDLDNFRDGAWIFVGGCA